MSRWTKERIAAVMNLLDEGKSYREIGEDPSVQASKDMVGVVIHRERHGLRGFYVPRAVMAGFSKAARLRETTPQAVARRALEILSADPDLLTNVLDDDGASWAEPETAA